MAWLLASVAAGVGCGSGPVATTARASGGRVATDVPPLSLEAGSPRDRAHEPPLATRPTDARHAALVAAALARVPTIAQTVADIRHLPLKHPVPAELQTQEAFRRYLDAQVKKDLPADKSAQAVRALVRLGLLKTSIDLGSTIEDALVSQAGAYYDPPSKTFYLVLVPEDVGMLDVMSAHELTHALDDQYFDLAAYDEDPKHPLSNDEQQARRFVGEGEATLVMLAYQAKVAAKEDIFDPKNRLIERKLVETFAAIDSDQLAKAAADNPALVSQMGADMKASIDAMSSIPPFILDPLFGAYTKGAAAVAAVRDQGGWDAVSALYTDPPESTEQLLHPLSKLLGKRDRPVRLTFAPLPNVFAGQTPLDTDVVGELTMAVYFKNWGVKAATAAVVGWGGDRYAAFVVGDQVAGVWLTTWDTEADAARFQRAYVGTLAARFAGRVSGSMTPTAPGATFGVTCDDGLVTATRRSFKDVAIVDGIPSAKVGEVFAWLAKSSRSLGPVVKRTH